MRVAVTPRPLAPLRPPALRRRPVAARSPAPSAFLKQLLGGGSDKKKRGSGGGGGGGGTAAVAPARVPLATRWRAVKGETRDRLAAAWAWVLALPVISHALAAAAAAAAATQPARTAAASRARSTRERYRKWRAAETRARWAWSNATRAEAALWGAVVYNGTVFAAALPYLALCPAHWAASVALPAVAALTMFKSPFVNPVWAALAVAAVGGKWRPGLLQWALGIGA